MIIAHLLSKINRLRKYFFKFYFLGCRSADFLRIFIDKSYSVCCNFLGGDYMIGERLILKSSGMKITVLRDVVLKKAKRRRKIIIGLYFIILVWGIAFKANWFDVIEHNFNIMRQMSYQERFMHSIS